MHSLRLVAGGGGEDTILPDSVIEVKEFESTTDSQGELNIQFDNGNNTSEDNIYTIAFIELGGDENNLISDRVFIDTSTQNFQLYSATYSKFLNCSAQLTANGKINIYIENLNSNTTYKYIGFLVRTI